MNKEVCPTCGSKRLPTSLRPYCPDPWHKVDSLPVPKKFEGRGVLADSEQGQSVTSSSDEVITTRPLRNLNGPQSNSQVDSLPVEAPPTGKWCFKHSQYAYNCTECSAVEATHEHFWRTVEREGKWVTECETCPAVAGVEAKPASKLTALDDGRYDEPASKEEEDHGTRNSVGGVGVGPSQQRGSASDCQNAGQAAVKRFTIEVLQEKDGRWLADIPSVPGAMAYCLTQIGAIADALIIRDKVLDMYSRAEKL